MSFTLILFLVAATLLAYTYVGYPLLLWCLSGSHGRAMRTRCFQPSISILVVAHNEETRILDRISNVLQLDYPRALLEIVIASDGSTDGTVDCIRRYANAGIRAIEFARQRGKPSVLNDVVPLLRGDIVILMDVRQRIEPDALHALVAPFANARIGAVSGELMLHQNSDGDQVGNGIGFYWRYEKFIRLQESQLDSMVGVTGALYALRKRLFQPVAADTLLDDVLIPLNVARQGYRVVFEPTARAHDLVAASADAELTRKVRTIAGNFQLLSRERWVWNPYANPLWWQTLSHKGCRLAGPLCLVTLLLANLLLLDHVFFRLCLLLQLKFYAAAALGLWQPQRRLPLVHIASAFCLLNWATVLGCYRFLLGRQQVTWRKAQA